jgi:ATP-binding cassette subfamily B protein
MWKVLRFLGRRERMQTALAVALIFVQVWLDLTLPDYMAAITTLVETAGSQMSEVLEQGGWMLACALGSMAANLAVTYLASRMAASLGATLRRETFNRVIDLSKGDEGSFGQASLVNRCTNDVTQVQNFVSMGLNAIVKAPVMAVWAVLKIVGYGWQWSVATAVAAAAVIAMLAFTVIFAVPRFQRMQSLTDSINLLIREHLHGIRPCTPTTPSASSRSASRPPTTSSPITTWLPIRSWP